MIAPETTDTQDVSSALRRALHALKDMRARLEKLEREKSEPIAVVGLHCRFPGAEDLQEFRAMLREGVDAVREIPADRWPHDRYYDPEAGRTGKIATRFGGFVPGADLFDAEFFGISQHEADSMDPQQRLLLEVAWNAIEHAGLAPDRLLGTSTGVFIGSCTKDYSELLGFESNFGAYRATGNATSILAGRLSYALGFRGPSLVVDTACSSSLVAVHLACQSLRNGECSMALAGGVNRILTPGVYIAFSSSGMLAPDGRCKTFDARADGFVRGEGCGVVVLKRLSEAEQAGDRILGVILGSAVNQDGRSSGLTAPNGPAQESVIRRALQVAQVEPWEVQYVEAHGTGTKLGDPIEVQALNGVLGEGRKKEKPLRIGSVKTNIGHLEAAAGIAGLIKVVLALGEEKIPPQLHFAEPNPHIEWERMAVEVVTEATPWHEGRRVAGVSSFGFGGTNAHVVLERAPEGEKREQQEAETGEGVLGEGVLSEGVLRISARTPEALRELTGRYTAYLETTAEGWLDICSTAENGRARFEHELAVRASSVAEGRRKLLNGEIEAAGTDYAGSRDAGTKSAVGVGRRKKVALPLYPFQRQRYWPTRTSDFATLRERIDSIVPDLAADCNIEQYRSLLPEINELCRNHFLDALHNLGWSGGTADTADRLGIVPGQRRLFDVLMRRIDGDADRPADGTSDTRWEALLLRHPECEAEVSLLRRCCHSLASVLSGRAEPLEALFPGGSLEMAERFYRDSPAARYCHGIVREAVAAVLDRRGVVLEIGAGTGATTSYLLPLVQEREAEYVFTDLSPLFHAAAKKKFQQYNFVKYELLDIEKNPGPPRCDLVVASNVLHATKDIRAVLRHIAGLLRPGGWLVLLETTIEPDWAHLISAGLLEGWWNFEDTGLRRGGPLLTRSQWLEVLAECGFPGTVSAGSDLVRQSVFVVKVQHTGLTAVSNSVEYGIRHGTLPADFNSAAFGPMVDFLRKEIASVLGFDSTAMLDPKRGLFDIGLDSLAAIELRNRLQNSLGRPLPAAALFENPTIESLARYLESPAKEPATVPPAPAAARNEPIAIVGMDCRFPGGVDSPERFWELLSQGADATAPIPADRWDMERFYDPLPGASGKICTRNAGLMRDVDMFDAGFFGVSPREAASMDPQQRILLEVAWTALDRAGQIPALPQLRAGVFIGAGNSDYARLFGEVERMDLHFMSGNALSGLAGRLSYTLGLDGPSMVVDTACSSSLVAVHLACQSLRAGECDLALAGGVNLILSPVPMVALAAARMLAPDGRCKTFDAAADGFGRAEGCGVVVLKRLADTIADRDPVLAVIRGSAVNQDGRSSGFTVPNGSAQSRLIEDALRSAGVAPSAIQYVEAHGTGTSLGDPIEMQALGAVFSRSRSPDQPLYVGSVKTNIGHAEAASGIAGLIKVVLSLRNGEIPPHLHLNVLNPEIDLDAIPARIPLVRTPWPAAAGPRAAGVSAFGASGTNAHVIVEDAPEPKPAPAVPSPELRVLPLSAKSEAALRELVRRYRDYLETTSDSFADICFTASVARDHFAHRIAVVAAGVEDSLQALAEGASGTAMTDPNTFCGRLSLRYMSGETIDWRAVAGEAVHRRVALPAYPFQKARYWMEVSDGQAWRDWMYRIDWRQTPSDTAHLLAAPSELVARVHPKIPGCDARYCLYEFREILPLLDAVCVAYLLETLKSMGLDPKPGLQFKAESLIDRLGIQPRHERLIRRMIGMLLDDGVIESENEYFVFRRAPQVGGMALQLRELGDRYPGYRPVTTVLERCGENLPLLLRGELEPLQILFGGTSSTAVDIYEQAPAAHALNDLLRDAVAEALAALPAGHRLKVLEIGAGTGATTSFLLPLLDPACCEYWFTDISWAFLLRAQEKFGDFPALRYLIFDLERDPVGQGLPAREFDIIVAVNVVHATRDLRESLSHIRRVLAPESLLFLVEETEPQRWVDLTFGLTEGWWRFSDIAERPSYPLLGRERWLSLLEECGFRQASAIPDKGDPIGGCVILLARGPSEVPALPPVPGTWLILADRSGMAEKLKGLLSNHGDSVIAVEAHESPNWGSLLPGVNRGIVHLWGLDDPITEDTSAARLQEIQDLNLGALASLARSISSLRAGERPVLWLVTRCARALSIDLKPPDSAHAPGWSFTDVALMEHPELACRRIDIDDACDAETLLREMQREGREDQIALRGGMSYSPRLIRYKPENPRAGLRLRQDASYLIAGGLSGVGLSTAQWMVDRGARHLVLIGRKAPSSDAVMAAIGQMRRSGAEVNIFQGDISRNEDLAAILTECRSRMPPLRGVVNSAMVLEDAPLLRMDLAGLRRVMAPKIQGSWNLHQLTLQDPLELFILYSAIISVFGNPGQAAYAASNGFLDSLAEYRRCTGRCGLSVNWGAWGETGAAVTAGKAVRKVVLGHGIEFMAPRQALLALESAITAPYAQIPVFAADWEKFMHEIPADRQPPLLAEFSSFRRASAAPRRSRSLPIRERLRNASADAITEMLDRHVREVAAAVLGLKDDQLLDTRRPLQELGMDSLMAVEMRNALGASLERTLPATLLFDYPTVERLSEHLAGVLSGAARSVNRLVPSSVLGQIEALSDEEVERLFAEKAVRHAKSS